MERLRLLVSAICLRRTKDCLGLPPRENRVQQVVFSNEENTIYEACKQSTVDVIELVFKDDGKLKSFATVIQLILRLRQICNHGKKMLSAASLRSLEDYTSARESPGNVLPLIEKTLCGLCGRQVLEFASLLRCMHPACASCFEEKEISTSELQLECSICAGTISPKAALDLDNDHAAEKSLCDDYQPSSKVVCLLKNLHAHSEESADPPIKRLSITLAP